MTEERRRWREYYEQKWPAEIHGYEETAERIAFISQQRKEAARKALEAAVKLSDEIELKYETSIEEWKGFKHFRNALRDQLKHIEDL